MGERQVDNHYTYWLNSRGDLHIHRMPEIHRGEHLELSFSNLNVPENTWGSY